MKKLAIYTLFTLLSTTLYAQSGADSLKTVDNIDAVGVNLLWDGANTAYINGEYSQAIDIYNEIIASGRSSVRLYYNIGNAYFKDNQLAQAILYYNRALQISPGSSDVRYNLEIAESATKDNIETIPEFVVVEWLLAVQHTMGGVAWSIISLVALAMMLSLCMLYLLSQRLPLRKMGFFGSLFMFILFIGSMTFAARERKEIIESGEAIVMNSAISVKSSPDRSATDLFVIHEGTKVGIATNMNDWCEITIDDGRKGWVECSTIETI